MHIYMSLSSLIIFTLIGCTTYVDETKDMREYFSKNKYSDSLGRLESSKLKNQSNNKLLYHLEKAVILDRLDELEKSRSNLLEAERIANELYTVSMSRTFASCLVNDSSQDYFGENFERIAIHLLLIHSFLSEGKSKLPSALVEARKINYQLDLLTRQYDKKYRGYHTDAYAYYLAGLVHEAMNNIDDAIIDYKKALELYSSDSYRPFYRGKIPKSLVWSLYGLSKRRDREDIVNSLEQYHPSYVKTYKNISKGGKNGFLVVIHESGKIAAKEEKTFVDSIQNQVVQISFPVYPKPGSSKLVTSRVEIAGYGRTDVDSVADLNAIAFQCLEDRRNQMILKQGARLLAKGVATSEAHDRLGVLGGLAANVLAVESERADTRSWSLLHGECGLTRIVLPPGKHTVQVIHEGKTMTFEPVDIVQDEISFLRVRV